MPNPPVSPLSAHRTTPRLFVLALCLFAGIVAAALVVLYRSHSTPRASTALPSAATAHSNPDAAPLTPLAADAPASPSTARPSLSADQRRALAALEAALRTSDSTNANALESLLWRLLPELLDAGGAPLADRLLATCPPGASHQTFLRVCAIAWPRLDLDAALAWANGLSDADERRDACGRVLMSAVGTDPAQAASAAFALDRSGASDSQLTPQLVGAWANQDSAASRAWTLHLPPGESRDACVARLATVQAGSDPADAARFALKHLPPGPLLDETLISAVYQWAGRDPASAQQWAEAFPDGPLRDRALQEVRGSVSVSGARSSMPGTALYPVGNSP